MSERVQVEPEEGLAPAVWRAGEEAPSGLRVAKGAVLQVHPRDRRLRRTVPAQIQTDLPVTIRNTGTEPLTAQLSADVAWIEPVTGAITLPAGESGQAIFRVRALALVKPGTYHFTGFLRSNSLLEVEERIEVSLEVTGPVQLLASPHGPLIGVAPAWTETTIELEVRRSDGAPCRPVTPKWPEWLREVQRSSQDGSARFVFSVQAPGRSSRRSIQLRIGDEEPGVEPVWIEIGAERRPGPILAWEDRAPETGGEEAEKEDLAEPSHTYETLPNLFPGESRCTTIRVKNMGDQPAHVRVHSRPEEGGRDWLVAGFARGRNPSQVPTKTLRPGQVGVIRVRLTVPLPRQKWSKDAHGRQRRARGIPVGALTWPGGEIGIGCTGAPMELVRIYRATVRAGIQPVPIEEQVTPACLDLAFPLITTAALYAAAWITLGDYPMAQAAEPILRVLGARVPPSPFGYTPLAAGVALVVWWVLYAVLLSGTLAVFRMTPGQAYAGFEVRGLDGSRVSPAHAALRGLLQALLLPLVAWIAAFLPGKGSVLDTLTRTRVVRVVPVWESPGD